MDYYGFIKYELAGTAEQVIGETVKVVSAKALSPEEAIGKADRADLRF